MRVVVMGVSGSGKTTIAHALGERLDLPVLDADDLHPASNVAKMSAGIPLDDDDRRPWLSAVATALAAPSGGAVVACSALRRRYRDRLREASPDAFFVHLECSDVLVKERMSARGDHFMPVSLVASQRAALEPLESDEAGVEVSAGLSIGEICTAVVRSLR